MWHTSRYKCATVVLSTFLLLLRAIIAEKMRVTSILIKGAKQIMINFLLITKREALIIDDPIPQRVEANDEDDELTN